jgi:thioredoxin reductase (NADPH)
MSQYLIERIAAQDNIDVIVGAEITALEGEGGVLKAVTWRDRSSGTETRRPARLLFSFIGAEPNTGWLASSGLQRDARGFLLAGENAGSDRFPLETSRRGVFAVGDVRSCSVKRVAAAVGDGAQVVAAIHAYLSAQQSEPVQVVEPVAAPA